MSVRMLALFFSMFFFLSGLPLTLTKTSLSPPLASFDAIASGPMPLWNGLDFAPYQFGAKTSSSEELTLDSPLFGFGRETCDLACPALTSFTAWELATALVAKVKMDTHRIGTQVISRTIRVLQKTSTDTYVSVVLYGRTTLFTCARWMRAFLLVVLYAIMSLAYSFLFPLLALLLPITVFLCVVSALLRGVGRLCSIIFDPLLLTLLWFLAPVRSLKGLSKRRYKIEQSVEGLRSFSVPMNPPRKSVVQLTTEEGCHGYASVINTFNGPCLLTAYHNLNSLYKVTSEMASIPLTKFTTEFLCHERDIAILSGPANWTSVLGVKSCDFVAADRVGPGPVSFFVKTEEGTWEMRNGILSGFNSEANKVEVLSNTTKGFSGTPYFVGKSVVGVHVGHPDHNVNYMAPIPLLVGLTAPEYVCETTAPRGTLVPGSYASVKASSQAIREKFKGKAWADYTEADDEEFYKKESGNGSACGDKLSTVQSTPIADASGVQEPSSSGKPGTPVAMAPVEEKPFSVADMNTMLQLAIEKAMAKIDVQALVNQKVNSLTKKPRNRRRRSKKSKASGPTPQASTTGVSNPAKQTVKVSPQSVSSATSTSPAPKGAVDGVLSLRPQTPAWRKKSLASAGPSSGPKPN